MAQVETQEASPFTFDLPLAQALRINPAAEPRPGKAENIPTVTVRCPFCGSVHKHGWRRPGEALALRRIAHCEGSGPAREYVIGAWQRAELEAGYEEGAA